MLDAEGQDLTVVDCGAPGLESRYRLEEKALEARARKEEPDGREPSSEPILDDGRRKVDSAGFGKDAIGLAETVQREDEAVRRRSRIGEAIGDLCIAHRV